ncbi:MAG: carbonic anhydrase [Opitutus sp.]|nr:carbonic anhydrase [Opitutus sp.]
MHSVLRPCILMVSVAVTATALASTPSVDSATALQRLAEGNQRFVSGKLAAPRRDPAHREQLAKGQHPFAVVLTCADSRLAPEIYFDQGLGDLFVLRNAGNVVDDHVLGSIEYAVEHLGARLILVVGHSKCGAVAATVAGGEVPGHIGSIVRSIAPSVGAAADATDKVDAVVRANARHMAEQIAASGPILSEAVRHGALRVVAARYDLATGEVQLLDNH